MLLLLAICLFTPPADWQPAKIQSRAEIGFVQKGSGHFNPSIHLIEEKADCSLDEYVKAVSKIHRSQPNTQCTDLGKIAMKAGQGRLLEIRKDGKIVLLQGIYHENKTAHVITAAVAKTDLAIRQREILASIRSLEIVDELWSSTPPEDWDEFKTVVENHESKYWQYLALKERANAL